MYVCIYECTYVGMHVCMFPLYFSFDRWAVIGRYGIIFFVIVSLLLFSSNSVKPLPFSCGDLYCKTETKINSCLKRFLYADVIRFCFFIITVFCFFYFALVLGVATCTFYVLW